MGFKFVPIAQAGKPAAAHSPGRPWKRWLLIGVGVLIAWYFFGSLLGLLFSRSRAPLPDTGPVLLAIQQQGELHTVKVNMKDVLHFETDKEPEGWVRNLPGAESIVRWATHNQALVVAEGTVEAGLSGTATTRDRAAPPDAAGLRAIARVASSGRPVPAVPRRAHARAVSSRAPAPAPAPRHLRGRR